MKKQIFKPKVRMQKAKTESQKAKAKGQKVRKFFTFHFLLLTLTLCVATVHAQSTEFTYQGRLLDSNLPPTANYDFQFSLWDALANGTQQGSTQTLTGVAVANGIFTVRLNFGAQFTGAARFLQIAVQPAGGTTYLTLAPRQSITSSPYSIKSATSTSADGLSVACNLCVTDAHILSIDGAKVTSTVANATTAVNVSGIVPIANGGTGSSTKNFVDLSTNQTNIFGAKTFNNAVTMRDSLNVDFNVTADQFFGDGANLTNVNGTMNWLQISGLSQQAQRNTGYVANNAAQVTITLPDSATLGIGDVVRVSGMGAGGWKILANPGQSFIGYGITNTSGWTPHESNREWTSVASSDDGMKLVATVGVSVPGRIYTSTDSGNTWTPRESDRGWRRVASSADGTRLAAVSFGKIYTSSDSGVTWTPRDSDRDWVALASSADGSKLVALTQFPYNVFTSTDFGATWTQRGVTAVFVEVASSADGTKLAAVSAGLGEGVFTSSDSGVTWTPRITGASGFRGIASSADGMKLAASDNSGRIFTSTDSGVTWTDRGFYGAKLLASSADGTQLLAAGIGGGNIITSADSGITWVQRGSSAQFAGGALSADGVRAVVVVYLGRIFTFDTNTPGGVTILTAPSQSSIELQYIGNGRFMTLSQLGPITGISF